MDKASSDNSINNNNETEAQEREDLIEESEVLDTRDDVSYDINSSIPPLLEEVDKFLKTATEITVKSNPPEIPESVQSLLKLIEKKMVYFDHNRCEQEEMIIYECLTRISKLIIILNEFTSNSSTAATLNRATTVLHLVMSILDTYFRTLLESCFISNRIPESKTPKSTPPTTFQPEINPTRDDEFPGYASVDIANMTKIATAMVTLGYAKECSMAYNMIRRNALNSELDKLGFTNISVDGIQRMQWESLEAEMVAWIQIFKHCLTVLFPGEQKLCESVFLKFPPVAQKLFSDLASAIIVRFLNFAEAVTLTKRSAEKLFKFLDMYETLRDAIDQTHATDLLSEMQAAKARLGEAAVSIFCDLENSIRRDNGKTPVPSGAVHPLTRYTMNYLRYVCEYKHTLEQVFLLQNKKPEDDPAVATAAMAAACSGEGNEDGTPKTSPFAVQLNAIMELLDENLEMKSKLYRDPSLGYIFLMNNGRYILQKIKGSNEINDIMGATWCRKRSSDMRLYHKGYQRETWGRLLQCLNHEGLQVNGKVTKPVLKERFKMFTSIFEDIHKSQSTWVVSDEQLQSELRVSISAVIIPAYRSFLGRFQQSLSSGRQTEKYIKYQPEDLENFIEELFDGNPNSIHRKRA